MEMTRLEFKSNKIDTDIRLKMQEKIKDNKVHSGKSINVKQDLKDRSKGCYTKLKEYKSEEKGYITIDGVKDIKERLSVEVEKVENINEENSKGRVLDTKK
jgi:hypothetical protein